MERTGKGSLLYWGVLVILVSVIPYNCSESTSVAPVVGQDNNSDPNSGNQSTTVLPSVTPTSTPEVNITSSIQSVINNTNQTTIETTVATTILTPGSVTSKSNSSTPVGQTAAPTSPTDGEGNSSKSESIDGTTSVQPTNASIPVTTSNSTSAATAAVTTQSSAVPDNKTTVSGPVTTKTTLSPSGTTVTTTINETETTTHATDSSITIPVSTTQAQETQELISTTNKTDVTEQSSVTVSSKPSTVVTESANKTQTTVVVTTQSITVTRAKTTVSVTASPTTQTSSVVTSTASSPVIPSTTAPAQKILYINEVTVNKEGIFQTIEIQMKDQADLSHYVFVMVDGNTNKTMLVIPLRRFNQTNGLLVVDFSRVPTLSNKGIGLAIYYTHIVDGGSTFNDSWVLNEQGVVDALVIGKTYDGTSTKLVDVLTPGVDPFVLDPSKYGMEKSISRCSADSVRSTEMFALINPSLGEDNGDKCKEMKSFKNTLSLQIMMDCGILKNPNNTINKPLLNSVVKTIVKGINRQCHCGITGMHVLDPQIECCKGTNLDLNFVAPNKTQDDEFLHSFKTYIKETTEIEVNGQGYHLEKGCNGNCCTEITPSAPKKDNSKDVRVTVAVIVTLLILFLIIVLVVYMYMRKKKIAVHQFRMSRLKEEDDYDDFNVNMTVDDQDEFVGGQEATFDLKT